MGTLCRNVRICGSPLVLCVITGVAQEDPAGEGGRFWLIQEDGERVEIRVMRHLFTPRFGERAWVLLYRTSDQERLGRYVMAGHQGCSLQEAASLASEKHWRLLLAQLTPRRVNYWNERIAAATLISMLSPMLVGGGVIFLAPPAPFTLARAAALALLVALVFFASNIAANYFARRLSAEINGELAQDVRKQMLEAAQQMCVEMEAVELASSAPRK